MFDSRLIVIFVFAFTVVFLDEEIEIFIFSSVSVAAIHGFYLIFQLTKVLSLDFFLIHMN